MATLHIIQGFLGAGKTTFAKKLAEEVGGVHLNVGEWCMKLHEDEAYEHDWNRCFDETVDVLWKRAEEYLHDEIDVVFDMGFWNKPSRDLARVKAEGFNCELKHYYICARDEDMKERLRLRDGKIAISNLERFEELKKFFEVPAKDEKFIKIENY